VSEPTVNQRLVVLRPVGDGVKRRAHDADLKGMVVIRSPNFQLVPFKLHRFGQQRLSDSESSAGYAAFRKIPNKKGCSPWVSSLCDRFFQADAD
ncbi:hypothetical protein ACE1BH_22635, partial [Aeromonas jandaei]